MQPHISAKALWIWPPRGKGQVVNGTPSTRPIRGMFTNALPLEEASETVKRNNLALFGFESHGRTVSEHEIHQQTVVHAEMIGSVPGGDTPLPKAICQYE